MNNLRFTLHAVKVFEGEICVRCVEKRGNGFLYEAFTHSEGYGNFVYQFGFYESTLEKAFDFVLSNYSSGNLIWECDYEEV